MANSSSQNPLVDLGSTTVSAFNIIRDKEDKNKKAMLGVDDTLENTTNHNVYICVKTPQDEQEHKYFHSLSIDKQVEDFMGTAELRCPYDSDLMEYWEPIRNYCVIYGSNQGKPNAKILFIGRVRGVKQEGYELVIQFQDYGWKFKQMVTQSYANDNVLNKDGYTIMRLMFEALKIDSWVISDSAKTRLKQVGMDQDGNLTLNKKKVEEMPDLLKRLQASDPSKFVSKDTIEQKLKESEEHNIKYINYTLKYEKPTPVMKKISSEGEGGYESGGNIYANPYGSATGGASGEGGATGSNANLSASGHPRPPSNLCSSIGNSQVIAAMKVVWSYQRGYINDYSSARSTIINYAKNSPKTYSSKAAPCLATLAKYCPRKDGRNAAQLIKNDADWAATTSGATKAVSKAASAASSFVSNIGKQISSGVNWVAKETSSGLSWAGKQLSNVGSWFFK